MVPYPCESCDNKFCTGKDCEKFLMWFREAWNDPNGVGYVREIIREQREKQDG